MSLIGSSSVRGLQTIVIYKNDPLKSLNVIQGQPVYFSVVFSQLLSGVKLTLSTFTINFAKCAENRENIISGSFSKERH